MRPMGFQASKSANVRSIVELPINDFKHILFMGQTGSGKTTGGINPIIDSRLAEGYGMMIFDEKGKEHRTVKALAHRHTRLEDVLEFGKPHSFRINLLEGMSERQLENFLMQIIKGDDNWLIGAINMFMDTYRWLNSIKSFYYCAKVIFGYDDFPILVDKGEEEYEKKKVPIKHEISSDPITLAEIGNYFRDPITFTMITQLHDQFINVISKQIRSHLNDLTSYSDDMEDKLGKLDDLHHQTEEYGKKLKTYKIKLDTSEASGNNGVYFMLSSTLGQFTNQAYINDPYGKDIVELLESNKVIVINTESFSNSVLSVIVTKTLATLTVRAKKVTCNPISVVIDEANRVLTYDSDLHVDILRESKVEIVLAAQNHEQMIAKMGSTKWASFAQNFNTRLTFDGPSDELPGHHNVLDEKHNADTLAQALFLQPKELNEIELAYQANHGFYKSIQINEYEIAIYDHLLYEHKKAVFMYDIMSGEIREVQLKIPVNNTHRSFRNYAKTAVELNYHKLYESGDVAKEHFTLRDSKKKLA